MPTIPSIKDLDLRHMRVFLRADLNVPLENKKILDDFRLKATLPTIDYIIKHGGKVILATHIGKPEIEGKTNYFDENLSTHILADWFIAHGYQIDYEPDLLKAQKKSYQRPKHILLLENLRFFHGEKREDIGFAEMLADLADIYVNDAFALIHRHDTSVTLLPQQFIHTNKAAGILMAQEIEALSQLTQNPEQPFIIVLGGNKLDTKIELLNNYVTSQTPPSAILLGSALSIPFLHAHGRCTHVPCTPEADAVARDVTRKAHAKNLNIMYAQDFVISPTADPAQITSALCTVATVDNIPAGHICVDIGPQTIAHYKNTIAHARTIFVNGTMGIYENPACATGTREILTAIANATAQTIAGGGDAVAAIHACKLEQDFGYLSTGGGATLAFLSVQNPLRHFETLKYLINRANGQAF